MGRSVVEGLWVVAVAVTLGACSGTGPGGAADAGPPQVEAASPMPEGAPPDAGTMPEASPMPEAGPDAPDGSAGYPASHPSPPQSFDVGGPVLTHPKIVSVSFASDPFEAAIDTFATAMGTTTYWGNETKEYGVAPVVPTQRIHDPTVQPATVDDSQIASWLAGQLDGTHPAWPAPDGNTLYVLYFPPGTTVTLFGSPSCATFHGYHSNTQLPNGTPVPYAVVSRCAGIPEDPRATGVNYISAVASHEVIEALTDPLPMSNPAYGQTDQDHLASMFVMGGEVGDLCALVGNAFYIPTDFPYLVQRIWSNQVALTGHDPCLPEPAGQVYFNSAPVLTDTIPSMVGTTKGVHIPVGQSKTIEVDLFSEASTPGPWTVAAKEVGNGGVQNLTFSFDRTSGVNGDKLNLTIHVVSQNSSFGAEVFLLKSTYGTQRSLWFGLVGN
jgi:hypothetical protein